MATDTKAATGMSFDNFNGQQIFADRPHLDVDALRKVNKLKDTFGYAVQVKQYNLPKGAAPRPDGKNFWEVLVIHLTQPTNAIDSNGKIVEAIAGSEVTVAYNAHLEKQLSREFLSRPEMFEIAIRAGEGIEVGGGKNDMQDWKIKVGGQKIRTGAFLVGSATPSQLSGGQALAALNGTAQTAVPPV